MGIGDHDFGDARPFTLMDVGSYLVSGLGCDLCGTTKCYPLANAWPMGHSWSSAIAQNVMTNTCVEAGLSVDNFLCDAGGLPSLRGHTVSVATDDIAVFERVGARSCARWEHCSFLQLA